MRCALAIIMVLASCAPVRAATFVYVSKSAEQQIQIFRLNPDDGSLRPTATIDVDGAPGALSVDGERRYLFASLRTSNSLASFSIDRSAGGLTLLSRAQLPQGE